MLLHFRKRNKEIRATKVNRHDFARILKGDIRYQKMLLHSSIKSAINETFMDIFIATIISL